MNSPTSSSAVATASDRESRLKFEQVKLLYESMPLGALASGINAIVLAVIEWGLVNQSVLLAWLVTVLLVTVIRIILGIAYRRAQPGVEHTDRWKQRFRFTSAVAGALWGSAAFLIFSEQSVAHQAFLAFIIAGVAAGGVSTLSAMRFPIFSFIILAVTPLAIRFLMLGSDMGYAMGAMILLFSVIVALSANKIYLNIRQNIELRMQADENLQALAESEERFRELFEGNKSVELIIDPDSGRIIEANKAAVEFYGYSRDQLLDLHISDINTLSSEQIEAEMQLVRAQERDHFLFRHRLVNDEIRDVEVHTGPIHWKGQRVLYSIIHDVSERRRAERLVMETSDILKLVASGESVEGIYDAICRMHESMHPRMRASILSLHGNQLFHCSAPSLPAEYCEAINGVVIGPAVGSCGTAAFLGKEVMVEDIATDPLWKDYKSVALPHGLLACWSEPIIGSDGKVLGTFAMYFDHPSKPDTQELVEIRNASRLVAIVMEKEQRENLLHKLSSAIEQAGESVIITDRHGVIEYVNPSFSRITGYSREEVLGKNPRVLKSGNESDEYYKRMWSSLSKGETWQSSIINRRKDGSEYPALMTISPIRDNNGDISHYVGVQQDMTDHEMLEERFRQAQKMEALGTLVGGIAHDFNNVLAGMTGNLYLAKRLVADNSDVVSKLDSVEALSFRAAEMIKQLLAFARKGHVDMQPFGLTSFLKEASHLCQASIPENIRFEYEFCPEELVIKGDATQLQQVVMNLLNNARDAVFGIEDPKIFLRLEEMHADDAFLKEHPEINSSLLAHVSISDNGLGIAESDQEHIFEPFYTTKEVGKGTGLGLAMAYGSIQSHQGVIDVQSEPGRGSTFHIYLPVIEERKVNVVSEKVADLAAGQGQTILVVDDNENVRSVSRDLLQAIGYKVLEAEDGLEAIECFTTNQKDIALILMDVVMPNLGGVAAAQRIMQIDPDVPIIFATGYDKEAIAKSDMPSSDQIVLSKPYNIEELSQMIKGLLG